LNKGNFNDLKNINLSLGDIDLSSLSQIIKKSTNLKYLILRLHPNNFNKNAYYVLKLIKDLKKLKTVKITQNIKNPKYNLYLEKIFEDFPYIKERKYYFDEFIIGNDGIIIKKNKKNNILTIKCTYQITENLLHSPIQLLGDKEDEIKEKSIRYLNNKKINCFKCYFNKKGNFFLNILFKRPLTKSNNMFFCCSTLISLNFSNFDTSDITNMKKMFYNCISLQNLNLSNFNTTNVTDMKNLFNDLNKKCEIK
jgi:surface protein